MSPASESFGERTRRYWWVSTGVVLALAIAAQRTGLATGDEYRPSYASGSMLLGVGTCWVIDKLLVRPGRITVGWAVLGVVVAAGLLAGVGG